MHGFKALQRQPFHRAKRKLHQALTAVITRLQFRDGCQDGCQDGIHYLMSQSPTQLWEHGHMLTEYQVWVCYRAATHQLNRTSRDVRKGLDMQEASGLHRTIRRSSSYPLGLRRCVQNVDIHHHAVGENGGITRSNDLVQTSSIIAIGTGTISEYVQGYQASVPR